MVIKTDQYNLLKNIYISAMRDKPLVAGMSHTDVCSCSSLVEKLL